MSLKKLNKVTFLEPERQTTEAHQGPSKSLQETLEVVVSHHPTPPILSFPFSSSFSPSLSLPSLLPSLTPPAHVDRDRLQKSIKTALRDVEHHVDQTAASEAGVKRQLEEQVMKTKQEVVRLERMLAEELEAAPDVFEAEEEEEEEEGG